MNWDAMGALAEACGALAVLVTLIYLAMQVRESNKLARSSSLFAVLDGFSSNDISQTLSNPELAEINILGHRDWNSLPIREKTLFDTLMTQRILHMEKILVYYKNGLIDAENFSAWLVHTAAHLITPGGQQWLQHARQIFADDVIAELEHYIAKNPDMPSFMDVYAYQFEQEKH